MNEKMNNIYASPKTKVEIEQPSVVYAHKGNIVIDEAPIFPKRCHICNALSESSIKIKLRYYPSYIFLPLLWYFFGYPFLYSIYVILCIAAPCIVIILMVTKGKTIRFELPICELHERRRKIAFVATLLCCVAIVISLFNFFPIILLSIRLVVLLVCFIALFALNFIRPYIRIVRAKGGRYWLRGTGKAFRNSLPDW